MFAVIDCRCSVIWFSWLSHEPTKLCKTENNLNFPLEGDRSVESWVVADCGWLPTEQVSLVFGPYWKCFRKCCHDLWVHQTKKFMSTGWTAARKNRSYIVCNKITLHFLTDQTARSPPVFLQFSINLTLILTIFAYSWEPSSSHLSVLISQCNRRIFFSHFRTTSTLISWNRWLDFSLHLRKASRIWRAELCCHW